MTEQTASESKQHPTSGERPRSSPYQIRKWMRRHNRMLTTLGAFIVFATFILKDALREELAGLVEAIDKAESLYVVRENIRDMRELMTSEFRDVRGRLDALGRSTGPGDQGDSTDQARDLRNHLYLVTAFRYDADNLESNHRELLAALPKSVQKRYARTLKELYGRSAECFTKMDLAMQFLSSKPPDLEQAKSASATAEVCVFNYIDDVHHFTGGVFSDARSVKSANQERYELATRASWVLYGIGWFLGLVGRWFGIKGIGGD